MYRSWIHLLRSLPLMLLRSPPVLASSQTARPGPEEAKRCDISSSGKNAEKCPKVKKKSSTPVWKSMTDYEQKNPLQRTVFFSSSRSQSVKQASKLEAASSRADFPWKQLYELIGAWIAVLHLLLGQWVIWQDSLHACIFTRGPKILTVDLSS